MKTRPPSRARRLHAIRLGGLVLRAATRVVSADPVGSRACEATQRQIQRESLSSTRTAERTFAAQSIAKSMKARIFSGTYLRLI